MRERKLGRLAIPAIAAALVGCLALALPATGAAKKKKKRPAVVTTTVSSGSLALPIPEPPVPSTDPQTTSAFLRVPVGLAIPARATVTDVNASVRLDHLFDVDVEIYLASPRGVILLSRDNGGAGDNYGAGATSCAGTPTTFDSGAATPVTAGIAPFVGTFAPQESLAVLNGLKGPAASVPWTLVVIDDEQELTGTLYCWNLTVQYRVPPKKKKKRK